MSKGMNKEVIHPLSFIVHRSLPWVLAARPRTLAAAVVPVAVGTALAARLDDWQLIPALLCLGFALLVQVGTNFANDYFDFVKGADTADRVGPTRVVAAGLVSLNAMRRAIGLVFLLSFLVGINLVFYGGWWLVAVGVASIFLGLVYTAGPFPLAYHGLGDLFVFIFFGWIAVIFTFYVQTGFFAGDAWWVGAAIGALATNILAVNNARDRETDREAGKRTLVVRFGQKFARGQYLVSLAIAGLVPVVLWRGGYGPAILMPLILTPVAIVLVRAFLSADSAVARGQVLGKTGGFLLGYGALLAVGLWVS